MEFESLKYSKVHRLKIISAKFVGFRGENVLSNCSQTNGPTDGHKTVIDHPEHDLLKRANKVNAARTDGWKHDRYQAISYTR